MADAIARLTAKITAIPNVSSETPPVIESSLHTEFGPVLVVRPFTHTNHYWQVYF